MTAARTAHPTTPWHDAWATAIVAVVAGRGGDGCANPACGHAESAHNSLGYCRSRTTASGRGECACDGCIAARRAQPSDAVRALDHYEWGVRPDHEGEPTRGPISEKSARRMAGRDYDQGTAILMRHAVGPWEEVRAALGESS